MKIRRLLTLLIVILVILPSSIFVSANETEEPVNFDTVDWESYDISIEDLPQLSEWMKTAQLSSLFRAYKYMDGGYAYPYLDQLSIRMKNDFAGFIAALSQEDAEKQQKIAGVLSATIYNENDDQIKRDEFPYMVYSVKVSGSKQQYTLSLFKDEVEKYWGIPKQDDPILDYDTLDWSTLDHTLFNSYFAFRWMETAQLPALFRAFGYLDGAIAMKFGIEMAKRIKNDFTGVIDALSQENAEKQEKIINFIAVGIYNELYEYVKDAEFPDMVYSVKVSGSKQQYTLGLFKDKVEKYWGIPRTGDRFPVAETALCIVSLSLICLLTLDHRRRKYR